MPTGVTGKEGLGPTSDLEKRRRAKKKGRPEKYIGGGGKTHVLNQNIS